MATAANILNPISVIMNSKIIEKLFEVLPLERFLDDYYLRLPCALNRSAEAWLEIGDWKTFDLAIGNRHDDYLLVRAGERLAEPSSVSPQRVRSAFADGYTLVLRHLERSDARLAELARSFATTFAGEVDVHLYSTPAAQFGFGWHYDAEEVFIVQTSGNKEYSLRKNTVNPWPFLENLPGNMHYEREITPLTRCRLGAGDWLYIPSDYWHMGRAEMESISLAVGIRPTTGIDLLEFLRTRLAESMLWRRRFPVASNNVNEVFASPYFASAAVGEASHDSLVHVR